MDAVAQIVTDQPLTVYTPFRQELAEFKKHNATLVFDYEDPKGNKDARSHIYKLRQTAAAIEKKRKETNADAVAFTRKVNAEAAELEGEVRAMIAVHEAPLKEIEEREATRRAAIDEQIKAIQADGALPFTAGSALLSEAIDRINAVDASIDAFGNRMPDVAQAKESALGQLQAAFLAAKAMEAERAELDRLRKQEAERAERERVEQEAREAAERKAAEEKAAAAAALETAQRAKEDAERRAADAEAATQREKEAAERRAAEAVEAERKRAAEEKAAAERKAAEAVEAERQRIEAEAAAQRKVEEARQRDEQHRAAVDKAALDGLVLHQELDPADLLAAIRDGRIPHITINY